MKLLVYDVYLKENGTDKEATMPLYLEENIIVPLCLEENTVRKYFGDIQNEYIFEELPECILKKNIDMMAKEYAAEEFEINPSNLTTIKLERNTIKEETIKPDNDF